MRMGKAREFPKIKMVRICEEERSVEILKSLAGREIKKYLETQGAESPDLEEVLTRFVTGEMLYDKRG